MPSGSVACPIRTRTRAFPAARDRLEDLDARIARPDQSRRALSFLERGVLLPASPVVSPRARRLPRYFQNPLASQKTATQHLRDLENPPDKLTGQRQTPEIIEFLNICDYTHQVVSKVDVEEPLFQPFPPELGFHKYAPRKQYEQTLWFRNNDYVPRRIRIEDPRSRHFTVRRMRGKKGEKLREETDGKSSKVAPGMEVAFKVTFSAVDVEDYAMDLDGRDRARTIHRARALPRQQARARFPGRADVRADGGEDDGVPAQGGAQRRR